MNAQTKHIHLSDSLTIHQEVIEKDEITYWKIFLLKKGEKSDKLLENWQIAHSEIPRFNFEEELEMVIPDLIDAYKEGQRIYVFLYKQGSAKLQIYDFENGVDFKKYEYSIIPFFGFTASISGVAKMYVYKEIIGKTCFADVYLERFGGKNKLLMLREQYVYELIFKDTEKTKTFTSPLVSREKEYLQKEIREKLIEHKFLKENNQFVYLGYLDDAFAVGIEGSGSTYFFYKDDIDPFQIKVIKYDNSYKIWTIGGYTENKLLNDVDKNKWGIK